MLFLACALGFKAPLAPSLQSAAVVVVAYVFVWVPCWLSQLQQQQCGRLTSPGSLRLFWSSLFAERRTYRNSFRVHSCISLFMFCEAKCRVHRLSAEPGERESERTSTVMLPELLQAAQLAAAAFYYLQSLWLCLLLRDRYFSHGTLVQLCPSCILKIKQHFCISLMCNGI